jgi:hypothetical protein
MLTSSHVSAHGTEARYVHRLPMRIPHVANVYGLSYTELGIQANRVPALLETISGRQCVTGTTFGVDVDDTYAFDIDEPVTLKVTYAVGRTRPFTVYWDSNSAEGQGRSSPVQVVASGQAFGEVVVQMERARLAGQGSLGIDIALGTRDGMAICGLEVTRSNQTAARGPLGTIRLEVRDGAGGDLVPARVGLYDATGRLPLPSTNSVVVHRFADDVRRLWVSNRGLWPLESRQAFYVNGKYEAQVPAGTYTLLATRGFEYRTFRTTVTVRTDRTTNLTVNLSRYANLPAAGWYSSDGHIHVQRMKVDDQEVWDQVAGEDLHIANLVQMGNITGTHFLQPDWGKAGRFQRGTHVVMSAQEDPRTVQHGHTVHHNLTAPIHLWPDVYFNYHDAFEESHRQGGVSGYAHQAELFNGRRGLALDAPFGLVDFIEILQNGALPTEQWYGYLNMGFKIWPEAGSDFPYMDLPGVVRNYVHLDGPFNVDDWFAAFRKGRVFVSNGPFVNLTVNGHVMGDELRVDRGATVHVEADASLNPDFGPLDRLELVVAGDVVETVGRTFTADKLRLSKDLRLDRGVWLAVRAYGRRSEERNLRVAHSAPIFVTVDDTGFVRSDALPQLVARQRQLLAEMISSPVDPMGDLEPWETKAVLSVEYQRQLETLKPRIMEADRRYRALLGPQGEALAPLVLPRSPDEDRPTRSLASVGLLVSLAAAVLLVTRVWFRPAGMVQLPADFTPALD